MRRTLLAVVTVAAVVVALGSGCGDAAENAPAVSSSAASPVPLAEVAVRDSISNVVFTASRPDRVWGSSLNDSAFSPEIVTHDGQYIVGASIGIIPTTLKRADVEYGKKIEVECAPIQCTSLIPYQEHEVLWVNADEDIGVFDPRSGAVRQLGSIDDRVNQDLPHESRSNRARRTESLVGTSGKGFFLNVRYCGAGEYIGDRWCSVRSEGSKDQTWLISPSGMTTLVIDDMKNRSVQEVSVSPDGRTYAARWIDRTDVNCPVGGVSFIDAATRKALDLPESPVLRGASKLTDAGWKGSNEYFVRATRLPGCGSTETDSQFAPSTIEVGSQAGWVTGPVDNIVAELVLPTGEIAQLVVTTGNPDALSTGNWPSSEANPLRGSLFIDGTPIYEVVGDQLAAVGQ